MACIIVKIQSVNLSHFLNERLIDRERITHTIRDPDNPSEIKNLLPNSINNKHLYEIELTELKNGLLLNNKVFIFKKTSIKLS